MRPVFTIVFVISIAVVVFVSAQRTPTFTQTHVVLSPLSLYAHDLALPRDVVGLYYGVWEQRDGETVQAMEQGEFVRVKPGTRVDDLPTLRMQIQPGSDIRYGVVLVRDTRSYLFAEEDFFTLNACAEAALSDLIGYANGAALEDVLCGVLNVFGRVPQPGETPISQAVDFDFPRSYIANARDTLRYEETFALDAAQYQLSYELRFERAQIPYATYTVKAGDSLSVIGAQYDVPYQEIIELNELGERALIIPGQILKIPLQ